MKSYMFRLERALIRDLFSYKISQIGAMPCIVIMADFGIGLETGI